MQQQGPGQDGNLVGALLDGRYRVGPVLARGGMSTVYRGTDTRLERSVAIKVMAAQFAADPVFLQRFEREARAAARLDHPGIVAVHDQGVDHSPQGDHVFLVMELVEGGTLRDLLREQGQLPVPLAVSVADMVLAALAAAHRQGFVHRDIKPENVLIGPGGVVKVADFGLVRAAAAVGNSTGDVILGTVAYLSPEQVATGAADARSDVYAAGIMLFEMLTGAPPYTGETALSVAYRHVNEDIPAPSSTGVAVPEALDALIVEATRRDPQTRPPDAGAFLQRLQELRTALGIERVPVPVPGGTAGLPSPMIGSAARGPRGTRALTRADFPILGSGGPPVGSIAPGTGVPVRTLTRPEDPYLRERARNRRAFIAWMVIVLMLASALGLGAWWLGSGRWTMVPNLTGLHRSAATAALASADLQAALTEHHSDTAAGDTVISTDPGPGQRAMRGSTVTVVISLGHPVVPNVPAGSSTEDAEGAIRSAELTPQRGPDTEQFHDTIPAGDVIGLQPAPGTVLTVGAPVTILVSKGPAPTRVPQVRGLRQVDALAVLSRAGLTAQVQRQFDSQIPGGFAIGTDPSAGTGMSRGTSVVLLVSSASVVPDVVGLPVAQARQVLADAGLDSTVRSSLGGFGFLGGLGDRVIAQSPPAGRPVRPGSTIALTTL